MSEPIDQYRQLAQPPSWALRPITGGRLKGKTDINPQWRYQAMTEVYGLCGVGWRFEVTNKWTEAGPNDQVFAFADINLYVAIDGKWSSPIPGNGGNMLVEKESSGPHANDEAFKMAITDALSTAMKMLGMAADIYAGMWDGSKYKQEADPGCVIYVEVQRLYKAWSAFNPGAVEGKDDQGKLIAFAGWAAKTTGHTFSDVRDFREWSRDYFEQCQEALKDG